MKLLEFLYYRYYKSQCRMGNRDIAPFSAMQIICISIVLYYFSFSFLLLILFPKVSLYTGALNSPFILISFYFLLNIFLYFRLLHKQKYKKIIKSFNDEQFNKKNIWPILFPLLGFILLFGGMFLKMLQNQGEF